MNSEEKSLVALAIVVALFLGFVAGILLGDSRAHHPAWKEGFRYGILMYREADLDEDVNYVRWQKSRK